MTKQLEIRYRCVVCAEPVTMGHLTFLAMTNAAIIGHLQGESNVDDDGDYIAFVCAKCQEKPEETSVVLAAMPWPSGVRSKENLR